ncbi:MAG: MerR family transcriptional regulator [Nevskia sp.]
MIPAMKRILSRRKRKPEPAAPVAAPARAKPAKIVEYTIDELARIAKTTVRNVRAYQDRGIIPPPERRGRAGVYGSGHLSRLRIIGQLLTRGYTLASIGELIEALDRGQDLARVLGIEAAVASPWTDEEPTWFSLPDLVKLYGGSFDPRLLMKVTELDILQQDGARFRAPSAKLLQAGAELTRIGIPLLDMLDVIKLLRANVERAAEAMVQLVDKHLLEKYGDGLPPPGESAQIGDLIWQLRPLVEMAVHAEVARAMQLAATKHLGDRLGHVLEQFERSRRDTAGDTPRRRRKE